MNKNIKYMLTLISLANILSVSTYASEKFNCNSNLLDVFNRYDHFSYGNNQNQSESSLIDISEGDPGIINMYGNEIKNTPLSNIQNNNVLDTPRKPNKTTNIRKVNPKNLITTFDKIYIEYNQQVGPKLKTLCNKLLLENENSCEQILKKYSKCYLMAIYWAINTSKTDESLKMKKQELIDSIESVINIKFNK